MQVVVPFAASSPKTRLESVLSPDERSTVARAMLADVLEAIVAVNRPCEPTVVSTEPLSLRSDLAVPFDFDPRFERSLEELTAEVTVDVDDRSLTEAVEDRFPSSDADSPVAVVMADLALATPDALARLFDAGTRADVAIGPGRGGGTNALVVDHPGFRVDYHGTSYLDHREIGRKIGATLETVDSFRLATDVDEPDDLVEVLVHESAGRTLACLRGFGFELEAGDGRVTVVRDVRDEDRRRGRSDARPGS